MASQLNVFLDVLALAEGRDKLYKCAQYAAVIVSAHLRARHDTSQWALRLRKVASALSPARSAIRLLRCVEFANAAAHADWRPQCDRVRVPDWCRTRGAGCQQCQLCWVLY